MVDSCYFGGWYQGYTPENDYEDSQIASFQWIFTLIGGGPSPFPSSNEIHSRDGPLIFGYSKRLLGTRDWDTWMGHVWITWETRRCGYVLPSLPVSTDWLWIAPRFCSKRRVYEDSQIASFQWIT